MTPAQLQFHGLGRRRVMGRIYSGRSTSDGVTRPIDLQPGKPLTTEGLPIHKGSDDRVTVTLTARIE